MPAKPIRSEMLQQAEQIACDWVASQQAVMCERTIALANINSGSFNASGVNTVRAQLADWFQELGATPEVLPVAPWKSVGDDGQLVERSLGDALRIRQRPQAPLQIFLCGHMDTVFAADHPFQTVRRLDADRLNGPGVADLKGGLMVMHTALMALEQSPLAAHIGWEVLLNPDEEIGSQSSLPLILEAAERSDVGLIYEPSFPDGNFAGARKGSGNFAFKATGRAAHAGREHHLGRNAIRAVAEAIVMLDDLNGQREGVTFNPGFIHGGGAVNVVPDLAMARFNVRMQQADDLPWCAQQIQQIVDRINTRDGITLELHGGFTRPPKVLSPANERLFALAEECGRELGLTLQHLPTGGCCDGNNLAAAGIPNIDTLGVHGGDIHSAQEWMRISSLTERAQLSAKLLLRLAAGHWTPDQHG